MLEIKQSLINNKIKHTGNKVIAVYDQMYRSIQVPK